MRDVFSVPGEDQSVARRPICNFSCDRRLLRPRRLQPGLLDHLIAEPGLNLVGCATSSTLATSLMFTYAPEASARVVSMDHHYRRFSLPERRLLLACFYRYASISVGNAFLMRLGRVSVALLRKKRRFAVLGGIRQPYARFLQLRFEPVKALVQ